MRLVAPSLSVAFSLFAAVAHAQPVVNVDNYTPVDPTTLQDSTYWPQRAVDPKRHLEVTADFDDDGNVDLARLMISARNPQSVVLVVTLSSRPVTSVLAQNHVGNLPRMGIEGVRPGSYALACEGNGRSEESCGQVRVRGAGLRLFAYGADAVLFRWNGRGFSSHVLPRAEAAPRR